ncbi:MAG TPA: DUF2027 domain-containing protein [Bacteroidales bacterium]|nr:DUF2027 domain-containing protein [Bacteroidales bacterium]
MANFKIGDKVSFISEKRDGIVKKIMNNNMVLVEIEEGFEIPVIGSDLINLNMNRESENPKKMVIPEEDLEIRFEPRFELSKNTNQVIKKGMYLAFIPENKNNIHNSDLALYLINNNPFDCLFSYDLLAQGKYRCNDFDRADAYSTILLKVISPSEMQQWMNLRFQFIFFKINDDIAKNPARYEIRLKPAPLFNEENFQFNDFLNDVCYIVSLSDKESKFPEELNEEKWAIEKNIKPSGIKIVGHINDKKPLFPEKYIIENGIAEVDLHIEELIDDYARKENFELLKIQIDFFSKMLNCAIEHNLKKIIFIHGVGNGRLKKEIIQIIKQEYPDLNYQDASLLRYGKGATEIIINL